MTDNDDRFGTVVPDEQLICPDPDGISPDREIDPADIGDIPQTPGWERAFAEYARQQAPDLMPRILAKINREAAPKTQEPNREAAPKTQKKRNRVLAYLADNRRQIIVSLSGVAAAVLIVGVLLAMTSSLFLSKKKGDSGGYPLSTETIAPTLTGTADANLDTPDPSSTYLGGDEFISNDKNLQDDPHDKNADNPGEPKNQAIVSDEIPNGPDKNETGTDPVEYYYSYKVISDRGISAIPLESLMFQTNDSRIRFSEFLLDVNPEGKNYSLSNFTIGEKVDTDLGPVYHIKINGRKTNLLLEGDIGAGGTYTRCIFSYRGKVSLEDGDYLLLSISISGLFD